VVNDGRCSAIRLIAGELGAWLGTASRLRAGSYSRRRFLGAAALAGGAWLAGCGSRGRPVGVRPTETAVRARVVRAELAAGAPVAGSPLTAVVAREDARHAVRLGAGARRPAGTADLATALARKQEAVFTFVDALPQLPPDERVALMQVLASEAGQIAALRLAAGQDPVPDAFAGFVT
jgi:hypothetical protein